MSLWITFLLVVQILVATALVGVILMQRSEGGGLGIGGSPAGLMSARGAADFLTRTTTILAGVFITLCIVMAGIAAGSHASSKLDLSLSKPAATAPATTPAVPMPTRSLPTTGNSSLSAISTPQSTQQPANAAAPDTSNSATKK